MTRITTHGGVSWLSPPARYIPPKQREYEEIGIACRCCTISRERFRSIRHARSGGWAEIQPWRWRTEPNSNHRGLCPACRDHPEEER